MQDKNTTKNGYVYLIGSSVFGWYKIGKAKTPEIRLDAIGILLPFAVELFGLWESEDRHSFERAMHERHEINHRHGEWFAFNRLEVAGILTSTPPLEGRMCFDSLTPRRIRSSLYKFADKEFAARLEENPEPVIRSHMLHKGVSYYI